MVLLRGHCSSDGPSRVAGHALAEAGCCAYLRLGPMDRDSLAGALDDGASGVDVAVMRQSHGVTGGDELSPMPLVAVGVAGGGVAASQVAG